MNKTALYNLLGKYLNNTCTIEEREVIDNLLELSNDDNIFASYDEQNLNIIHNRLWNKIQAETFSTHNSTILIVRRSYPRIILRWAVAASILVAITFTAIWFRNTYNYNSKNNLLSIIPQSGMIKKANHTNKSIKIALEDSSIIIIEPGTTVNYPIHFLSNKREIYLEGKAFFNVSKNAKRPFLIYHNNLVTNVIGTSFIINTQKLNKEVEVSVFTGKVAVSENANLIRTQKNQKESGVILTPNQKVIYSENTRTFFASIVDNPIPVNIKEPQNFVFEDIEMATVFAAISKEYAIEIVVENENINKCTFTGNITGQGLYSKLDAVCKSINSSYELRSTVIFIKGTGCE